jgi:class 3 adenylate cyclase
MSPKMRPNRAAEPYFGRLLRWGGFLTGERVVRRLAAILAADVVGYSRLMSPRRRRLRLRSMNPRPRILAPRSAPQMCLGIPKPHS